MLHVHAIPGLDEYVHGTHRSWFHKQSCARSNLKESSCTVPFHIQARVWCTGLHISR